ncbi:hypothetical protein N6H18_15545 [Reichenbachiella agarivorans]|uniref:Viral A-type inclusion protein n=1 Tax=Reichenbachiella agarivorans TaxID=2979464 RepID=A0ABY6CMM6_9BACT|nr:hypothetical protein [Reichenbachiella agarivorans]UXP31761.1 hypothetical protein N6H18_15545 [Reichenbachiella agarivorans]
MKKKYLIIAAMTIMAACTTQKPEPVSIEFNQLKSEVIEVHDIAMEQMGVIMKLKGELKAQLDTAAIDSTSIQAIADLEAAHEGMMVWMRGFADAFSGDVLANGLPANFETEEERKEAESALEKIKEQQASVQRMNEEIQASIAQAQTILAQE